jgi:flagellar hook-associated protein 1 FlgK
VVALGVEAQAAGRRVEIQDNILGQIDAARESESGVSLDEEMTTMLAFQKAYEGSARFMSAIDQMLDTLINRTGVVGR